jgi:hypothetical protein
MEVPMAGSAYKMAAAAVLACALVAVSALPAGAQMSLCGERAQLVEQLKTRYKESLRATGLIAANGSAELYLSDEGTWTLIATLANGKSCIIAAGHSWDGSAGLITGTGI